MTRECTGLKSPIVIMKKKAQDPAFLAHRAAQNRTHYVCTRDLPDQKLTLNERTKL